MLTVLAVLIFNVLVASADKVENPLLCVKLQPLHNVTLQQFQGSWVLLSMFDFVDGIPSPSDPEQSEECNWYLYGNVSGNSMTEYMEEQMPDNWEEEPESFQTSLHVEEGKPGRWIFNVSSSKVQVDSSEEDEDQSTIDDLVIVMAEPDYFVAASCDSLAAPVPDHERFVNLVSVLGRREEGKSAVISEQRLREIEVNVTKLLGFTMVPHVQQRTNC